MKLLLHQSIFHHVYKFIIFILDICFFTIIKVFTIIFFFLIIRIIKFKIRLKMIVYNLISKIINSLAITINIINSSKLDINNIADDINNFLNYIDYSIDSVNGNTRIFIIILFLFIINLCDLIKIKNTLSHIIKSKRKRIKIFFAFRFHRIYTSDNCIDFRKILASHHIKIKIKSHITSIGFTKHIRSNFYRRCPCKFMRKIISKGSSDHVVFIVFDKVRKIITHTCIFDICTIFIE